MKNSAAADVIKAERERIAAISALPDALGREGLAMHIATKTDMTVDQAKTALAAAPDGITDIQASGLWDTVLANRGTSNAATSNHAPAATGWDAALKSRGMQIGGGK
ncbi:hypothetical protein ACVIGB_006488 [Bradyrhizobium sp. USDA 4341]